MIPEPGDQNREVFVNKTFHEQTEDELTEAEIKQMEADDQAIQTILLGLPEDIYVVVDSCETAQEIWLRVQQMMKGSDIGIQEKKAKLFNEWERFTSSDGESIESYYHRFSKLMNDFKRNKHFSEKIASNLKLHLLYDFLKYNQKEVDELRAERLGKTHDPLALMENSNNPFNYPVFHQDQPSPSTYMQQPQPNNNYNPQPSFSQNYMQQPMPYPEDISDPTTDMNIALVLMAKAFKLNYSTPTNNNQRISSNPRNMQIAQPGMNMGQDRQIQMVGGNGGNQFRKYVGQYVGNQNGYNAVKNVRNQVVQNAVQNPGVQNVENQNGLIVVPRTANQNPNGNGNVVATRAEGNEIVNNGNQIRCYNCRGLGHFARNCTVRPRRMDVAYLQTQLMIAQKEETGIQLQAEEFDLMVAAADLDEIEEVNANCILMANLQQASTSGTQTDKAPVYDSDGSAELLEPIPEPHQVPQNDSNVISEVSSVEQGGGTVEQHSATVEETRAYHESLFHNLAAEVENVNSVNRKMKKTNAELTTKLARYKNQEKCFKISQEKYDKLERCYQNFVYQKQRLTKKRNALHLSPDKQLTTLNEEISNLNKQLSKEKSTVSSLQEEKKRLKSDFKIREDELLDLNPKPYWSSFAHQEIHKIVKDEIFPIVNQVDARALELEIEPLLIAVVSQDIMSIVLNPPVAETSDLQTELEQCKYDKISYDKAYSDMQQKIERLQAQLGYHKGKSKNTPCVSNTFDLLSQKLENENMELEFQVLNYAKENAHLKTIYKNLFDSISVTRTQTKTIIDSLQNKLHDTIYENAKLGVQLFYKVSDQEDAIKGNNAKTRRPQPKSNTKNDRVPSTTKSSCIQNKEVQVEEHPRNFMLSKNKKHMSFEGNNVKLAIRNAKSKVVCAIYKQCLITANHDVCVLKYENDMNSRGKKQKANVSNTKNKKKQKPKVIKTKKVSESESQSDCSNGDNACTSNPPEPTIKRFPNSTSFLGRLSKFFYGTVCFENDHVVAILGFSDLQWENILITRVYFVEGLGHNLFLVGQFCNSDLEVAFRRNTCFVRNLEGVELLKGNSTTNLYTINIHEMASAFPICLMARATFTKSWLWNQRLSHLNFDTINDLAKNDLVTGLPKFKYHKERLCPSCE
uniref:CCHC-type domain-containing protein n=1 Tax=Tanacetum cinerariifolium TaxID=118510 RepID=A0A699GHP2_TANCI|nr:hypothetical protein [Tanacetum cinerariifolium]